jgi:hypothetical protein
MRGVYSETDPDETPRQPAYVLSAWIAEQLQDVRQAQLRRLEQLRARLQSDAFQWDCRPLAQDIHQLHVAGRELRFLDLRHGWLARMLGRHRAAHARFAGAVGRIEGCERRVKTRAAELAATYKSHTSGARRSLVELDMEWQALGAEVDQGVTWLQDMCTQIGEARAQGSDDPQLDTLAEAAQAYTQAFKRLQSASEMAREISVRGHGVLERRAALLDQVKAGVDAFEKLWTRKIEPVLDAARAGNGAVPGIPKAVEAHDDWMKSVSATIDACTALQHEEHLMAQHLGMLHELLDGTQDR